MLVDMEIFALLGFKHVSMSLQLQVTSDWPIAHSARL